MKISKLTSNIAGLLIVIIMSPFSVFAADDATLSVQAAATKHATYRLDTWKQVVHKWRMLAKVGMRLKDLEVLEHENGSRTYAGVWEPESCNHALYRYSSWRAFVAKWNELNPRGYRLVDVERVQHGGRNWYYGVWRAGTDKYALYQYSTWKNFTAKWSELNGKGFRLVDIDMTEHNNVKSYVGVWRGGAGQYALFNYSSWSDLVDKWNELGPQGFQLLDMDITRLSNGTTRYMGVWRTGSTQRALYRYSTWQSFKTKWAELAEKGYSLLDVEVVQRNKNGYWYVGSFGPAPGAPIGGPDLNAMAEYLEDNLGAYVVGMSYALSQHAQLAIAGSTGLAQRSPDPEVTMSSKIRSTVASVSKTITAPLLYKLLDANGLTINSPITPWLPAAWVKGPGFTNNVSGVTFRHLLTHTSGLNQAFDELVEQDSEDPWGNDWDGLSFVVKNGTSPDSDREYKNANFALMRVLIPELWQAVGGPAGAVTEANVGQRYLDYMHTLVLDRESIESIICSPQAGYPEARSYNFDDPGLAGWSNVAAIANCGGDARLHFSAQELTQYAMAFRYDDKIMSPADRNTMNSERAGWSRHNAVVDGMAYEHNGIWNINPGRKTRTCIIQLPNGVNASIIFNSLPPSSTCGVLRQAYNAAF